jgi:PncC family amidohydrolase
VYGGVVAYNDEMKVKLLGVNKEIVKLCGAVSRETAVEMASGVRAKLGTDIGVAVTGFAGPSGDRVGEVCFAIDIKGDVTYALKNFGAIGRGQVIEASVGFLVEWLCEKI